MNRGHLLMLWASALALGFASADIETSAPAPTTYNGSTLPSTLPPAPSQCNPKLEMLYQQCTSKAENQTAAICKCVKDSAFDFKDCEPREALGYQAAKQSCGGGSSNNTSPSPEGSKTDNSPNSTTAKSDGSITDNNTADKQTEDKKSNKTSGSISATGVFGGLIACVTILFAM